MLSSQFAAASGNKDRGISISPALGVRAQDVESLSYQMRLMMIMTGLLLLIACANVAALLLAQGTARRKEIAAVDANVPIEAVPLTRQVESVYKPVLLTSSVLTAAGAIALFLSMIGLYGALSSAVSQRTREIGIRMALGAQTAAVLRMIVGQGLRLVLAGVLIGLLVAFAATRLMKTLLYGVSATDPLTYILIALLLTAVALIACLIPARRATKVDPLVALRYE